MIVKTTRIFSERLLPFLMSKTTLLALLLVFAVSGHAQTLGGILPGDDFDGDTVINSVDLDDDNDGILDTEENKGSVPLLSGFEALYPATLPPDAVGDDSSPALVLPANPIGSRVIVRNSLSYAGVSYHAIVEVTGYGALGSGRVGITKPDNNLALMHVIPANNPYFTYSLKFVSSVGFVDANYQNNTPIVGATIPNVTVVLADIDGKTSSNPEDAYSEVAGYKSAEVTSIKIGTALQAGGFDFPTPGTQGPGVGVFNYYRPIGASNTAGSPSISGASQPNWITIGYDSFTVGEYVYGGIAPTPSAGEAPADRGEGGPSIYMGNIDFTDIDGDGKDNQYDLDSDGDGCSDSNEAYTDVAKANTGYQYGNPTTGTNPIPGGLGGVAPIDTDAWPLDGKVLAASYTTTTAQYKPAVTVTIVNKPADVQLLLNQTTATFTTSAKDLNNNETASGAQTYKWQQQLNGASWNDITVDASGMAIINGVTYSIDPYETYILNISGITSALHNSNYRAVMSDATYLVCGSKNSLAGNLRLAVPPNPGPDAKLDAINTNEDVTGSVNVVTNDTDADGVVATTVDLDPSTPVEDKAFVVAGKGAFAVDGNGLVTFVPVPNYNGTLTITYTVKDTQGAVSSNVDNLVVTVASVNDAPVAVADAVTVQEDVLFASATVDVVNLDLDFNDTDLELSPLSVVAGTFTTAKGGTLVLAANGTYTYLSALNFNGTDTVNYTVTDGGATAVGTLTITVEPINDAPVAVDDNAIVAIDATSVIIQVASNDTDVDGNSDVDVTSIDLDPATAGMQTIWTVADQGTYTANANGTVTFVPVDGFIGTATPVNYVIQDLAGLVSLEAAKIKVSVNADSDGDGVLDTTEMADGTDPFDPCISIPANATEPKTADFSACDIVIYSAVSPNGDANNEYFKIKNIEKYANNTLQIFDRWGVVVYEADGYGQPGKLFAGQSEGRSTVSASGQLPVGTYFYALKYVDALGNAQERSGYLYINR